MSRGLGIQTLVLVAGAFIAGLVGGGLGPKAKVRALEQEAFELRRSCAESGGVGAGLAELLTRGLDAAGTVTPGVTGQAAPEPVHPVPSEPVGEGEASETDELRPNIDQEAFTLSDEPGEDPLEAARGVMEVRSAQARAALFEDIDPTDAQEQEIMTLFDQMNDDLITIAYDLVEQVREDGDVDRLSMMRTGVDTLDVLIRTEEQLLDSMSEQQRQRLGEGVTDPSAFVDPSVVDVLQELSGLERP